MVSSAERMSPRGWCGGEYGSFFSCQNRKKAFN
jgi:hypothetical protein